MQLFIVLTTFLASLASADVSHLGSFRHYFPIPTDVANYTPQKSNTQLQSFAQIESIRASVPVASFSIQQNINHGQDLGSNIYSSAQYTDAYKYNAPVQQQYSDLMQQQSYSTPIEQSDSSADQAPIQNIYLAPAIQPPYSDVPSYSTSAPAEVKQTYAAPVLAPAQNPFLPPLPQQQYSTSGLVQQQSYSAPAPVHVPEVQQSYSAPFSTSVQQRVSVPATVQQQSYSSAIQNQQQPPVQQQSYSSAIQNQQQPYGVSQQSPEGVKTTNDIDNGAYNYQAPTSAQALVQQSFAAHHQQSHSSSAAVESGYFNYKPSVPVQQSYSNPTTVSVQQSLRGDKMTSAIDNCNNNSYQPPASEPASDPHTFSTPASSPVQQTYSVPSTVQQQSHSSSAIVESESFNYHPSIPSQESLSNQIPALVEQSESAPVSNPKHQTVTASVGGENGSYNYQPATLVQQQYSTAVQQSNSAPPIASVQQSQSVPVTAPQSVDLLTPSKDLSAPPPAAPGIGTVYGKNGGYVYSKF